MPETSQKATTALPSTQIHQASELVFFRRSSSSLPLPTTPPFLPWPPSHLPVSQRGAGTCLPFQLGWPHQEFALQTPPSYLPLGPSAAVKTCGICSCFHTSLSWRKYVTLSTSLSHLLQGTQKAWASVLALTISKTGSHSLIYLLCCVRGMQDLSSQDRTSACPPALEAWSLTSGLPGSPERHLSGFATATSPQDQGSWAGWSL